MAKENKLKRMLREILDREVNRLNDTSNLIGLDITDVKKLEALSKILQIENNYQGPLDQEEEDQTKDLSTADLIELVKSGEYGEKYERKS